MSDWTEELPARILEARKRISPFIYRTPLELSVDLSKLAEDCQVYIKYESDQLTGAFKVRGAFNKVLKMVESNPKIREVGVTTASSGNHGLACIAACKEGGVPLQIFCANTASESKRKMLSDRGAIVRLHGTDCVEAEVEARRTAETSESEFISPYNDVDVLCGQGTIGYEILESLPDVDAVLVCVGGGGLMSGIASYIKGVKPSTRIYGCQPINSNVMYRSVQAGHIVEEDCPGTISDGSAGGIEDNSVTFDVCKKCVDDWIMVTEEAIEKAIVFMVQKHHKIIEGAAGVAVAAFMQNTSKFKGQKVAILSCGSNIGADTLKTLLNKYL